MVLAISITLPGMAFTLAWYPERMPRKLRELVVPVAVVVTLFVGTRFAPSLPWPLLAVLGATALTAGLDLAADGVHVAALSDVAGPIVVLETALPVKFAESIVEAIGVAPPRPERFAGIEDLPRHVVDIPNSVDAVRDVIEAAHG